MEKNIFRYILKYSARDQFLLLLLIISFQPLYLLSLELPKIIINSLKTVEVGNIPLPPYEIPFFGVEALTFEVTASMLNFLLLLSFMYLFIVLFTGAQKYAINVYIGLVGERLLRRLRYQLYQRVLRFPLKHFRKVGDGAIIPMITQEVEPVGGFAGSAFADPLFQGGQLVIAIGYIIYQDWLLGMAALAFYPVQMIVIPQLQKVVNRLAKERVKNVRSLSDNLGTSIRGVKQIHANNTSPLELARFSNRIGTIFAIRYKIYRWKFFIKFLNNFIDKLTPFFFFSIGGWLALEGRLDIGALFAALNAYKDVASPWKEMLKWYQTKEDVRVKYEQVTEQFEPKELYTAEKLTAIPPDASANSVALQQVRLVNDEGVQLLNNINLQLQANGKYAIVGDSASYKSELAHVIAGLVHPTSGKATIGDSETKDYAESFLGRRIAYADHEPFILGGSIYDNMVYGISNACHSEEDYDDFLEAQKSGNSTDNFNGDWIDWQAQGLAGRAELEAKLVNLCEAVELQDYLLQMGLKEKLPLDDGGTMHAEILSARQALQNHLKEQGGEDLIVPFATDSFNDHASVLENLVFGRIMDADSDNNDTEALISHDYMIETIKAANLYGRFLQAGANVVQIINEIFADLPEGHNLYQRFAFVQADDLPDYKRLLARIDSCDDLQKLDEADRKKLFSLPFYLIPKQHRLGIVDDEFRTAILSVRKIFRDNLPDDLKDKIYFYDPEKYNSAANIRSNILFGKIATDRPNAEDTIAGVLDRFIRDSNTLWNVVTSAGLQSNVGLRGERLNRSQKAKLILVRALLKESDILILDNALTELDADRQADILQNIIKLRGDKGLILVTANGKLADYTDEVIFMSDSDIHTHAASEDSITALKQADDFAKLL